jgi:hypothetical protein
LLVLKVSHPEAPHFPVHLQCLPPPSIPHTKLEPHFNGPLAKLSPTFRYTPTPLKLC